MGLLVSPTNQPAAHHLFSPTCAASCFCGDAGAAAATATAELRPAASCTCCCWVSPTSRFNASRARSSHWKGNREGEGSR